MNFVLVYDLKTGKVREIHSFDDDAFSEALDFMHEKIDEYSGNTSMTVSLVGVEGGDITDLKRYFGAFFHESDPTLQR
ncbi:MAG: hypothetical protein N3G75_06445 [Methanothrix sp.]|nr:hypothetical protein [Methanothrix sp.]MCX8207455.1 hypothetical protein [Methanothrix sp.]